MSDFGESASSQVRFALRNTVNYHHEKGAALCRRSKYANNHDEYEKMMQEAGRHFRIVDDCRRKLWMEEHRK